MLTVEQKEIIRREYFIHRKSMRQIARERHHSRKTIRKAIYDPGAPVYTRSKPAPQRTIGPLREIIRRWLHGETSSGPPNNGILPGASIRGSGKSTAIKARSGRCGEK